MEKKLLFFEAKIEDSETEKLLPTEFAVNESEATTEAETEKLLPTEMNAKKRENEK